MSLSPSSSPLLTRALLPLAQFLKAHAIAAQAAPSTPPPTPGLIDPKAQVSTDSLVGFSTKVGERTNIKKSVVGRHCVIGRNVRISGCVIMDFVVVGDGCVRVPPPCLPPSRSPHRT